MPRITLDAKSGDQCRKGGGLLSATRIVEEEAWKRRAPVLEDEDSDRCATLEVLANTILSDPNETRSVEGSLNHQVNVIE